MSTVLRQVATFFSLPLLAKELTETASRRRTYVLRVIYAVALFAVFALINRETFAAYGAGAFSVLGMGEQMFDTLLLLQFAGVALFLPALTAGLITSEKERGSFALLLLTDLKPWQIVLQKYIGGLVPMLSFLLLALPLGAIAYAFGGISPAKLLTGVYSLLLWTLQLGAIGLLCSAWFRSTLGAYLATYLGAAVFYAGPPLFVVLSQLLDYSFVSGWRPIGRGTGALELSVATFPPALVFFENRVAGISMFARAIVSILVSIGLLLFGARLVLVRRAFVPPSNSLRRLFRRIDLLMVRGNRLLGNITFFPASRLLPDDEPVAWREMTQKVLGQPQHLARILVALEVVAVLLSLIVYGFDRNSPSHLIVGGAFALVVLAISAHAANAFVAERIQQTLDVLLTTSLSATEIVRQKARVLRRLGLVLAIPLLTIMCFETLFGRRITLNYWHDEAVYAVCCLLTVAIYLPLAGWLSFWIGMMMRTRFRAIIVALGAIAAWCIIPLVVFSEFHVAGQLWNWPLQLSPVYLPYINAHDRLDEISAVAPGLPITLNFAFYGAILFFLRQHCLGKAESYLRR